MYAPANQWKIKYNYVVLTKKLISIQVCFLLEVVEESVGSSNGQERNILFISEHAIADATPGGTPIPCRCLSPFSSLLHPAI